MSNNINKQEIESKKRRFEDDEFEESNKISRECKNILYGKTYENPSAIESVSITNHKIKSINDNFELFVNLKKIEMVGLNLKEIDISIIPNSITTLSLIDNRIKRISCINDKYTNSNLTYLNLSNNNISCGFENLSRLYNIETLILKSCFSVKNKNNHQSDLMVLNGFERLTELAIIQGGIEMDNFMINYKLDSLKTLTCNIDAIFGKCFKNIPFLKKLVLVDHDYSSKKYNNFGSMFWINFEAYPNMDDLEINSDNISTIEGINRLSNLCKLVVKPQYQRNEIKLNFDLPQTLNYIDLSKFKIEILDGKYYTNVQTLMINESHIKKILNLEKMVNITVLKMRDHNIKYISSNISLIPSLCELDIASKEYDNIFDESVLTYKWNSCSLSKINMPIYCINMRKFKAPENAIITSFSDNTTTTNHVSLEELFKQFDKQRIFDNFIKKHNDSIKIQYNRRKNGFLTILSILSKL